MKTQSFLEIRVAALKPSFLVLKNKEVTIHMLPFLKYIKVGFRAFKSPLY